MEENQSNSDYVSIPLWRFGDILRNLSNEISRAGDIIKNLSNERSQSNSDSESISVPWWLVGDVLRNFANEISRGGDIIRNLFNERSQSNSGNERIQWWRVGDILRNVSDRISRGGDILRYLSNGINQLNVDGKGSQSNSDENISRRRVIGDISRNLSNKISRACDILWNLSNEISQLNVDDEGSQSNSGDGSNQSNPDNENIPWLQVGDALRNILDKRSQPNLDDEGNQSNSDDESNQSNSDDESTRRGWSGDIQRNSFYERSQSNSDETCKGMQSIIPNDKAYASAAKSEVFGIVRNHKTMAINTIDFSLTGRSLIFEEVFDTITSESLQRAIENGDTEACTEFLKNYRIFVARYPESVREMLERIDDDGERDINARDKKGKTLSFAKQTHNAEIVMTIEQKLFITAVENGDIEAVNTYLSIKKSNFEVVYRREALKVSITHSLWLKAVAKAQDNDHDEILNLLFNDDRYIHGFNEDGQTVFNDILHQLMTEYLKTEHDTRKLKTIEILLKSWNFSANVLNLQKEAIYEIICKIKPKYYCKIGELLQLLHQNGIDLNGSNKIGETFLMLSCKNKRFDIVRSLRKLASREFVLDIDAVDNSGETALMISKRNHDLEGVADLLIVKLIYAVENGNVDIVKSTLDEFRNTPDNLVKSWSSNQDLDEMSVSRRNKSDIWIDAIYIAMENDTKHSEEILKFLLDCGVLLSQEIETGYFSFTHLIPGWQSDDDERLRLIELLLKTENINVNDKDIYGKTALHYAEEKKLISLLIRYGADVSRKDNEGKTPSMSISGNGGIDRPDLLRTLLEEAGTLVDLDAVDCNGRTALMHSVISRRSQHAELLLNKGASVNLSDHLGFTALHYALLGDIWEHAVFPRNSEELKKIKELTISFGAETHKYCVWNHKSLGEKKRKMVKILLKRPDIDVNILSIENFSPLDIAEGQIPEIPSSIKDALKKKGAVLKVFRETESPSTRCKLASKTRRPTYSRLASDFHLDFKFKLTMTLKQLAKRVGISFNSLDTKSSYFRLLKKRWMTLIEIFKEQLVSEKDQQGRTALHFTAISSHSQFSILNVSKCKSYLSNAIAGQLIAIGCSVNETDIFGRTPLHYSNKILWELLVSKGADPSIKDKDGNTAIEKTSRESYDKVSYAVCYATDRNEEYETYLIRLMSNRQIEITVDFRVNNDDEVPELWRETENVPRFIEIIRRYSPELLWGYCECAIRHPLVCQITEEVRYLMDSIAKEIERLDPRFAIRPELVGSSNEGSRLKKPDEFDFCFVLIKFGELSEVFQSPELPTGFVRLKRKPTKVDKTTDFDSFFGKDGILNTEKLNCQFLTILRNALVNIERQTSLEWNLEWGRSDLYEQAKYMLNENIYPKMKKVTNIVLIKPLISALVDSISIDIVPCIHIDGWWPDEAISNVSDEIKKFGCKLVFDNPDELYRWAPYSESCARISFSKTESEMIKQSCANVREAYMIGKTMLGKAKCYASQYILKNCVLYCIEALSPSSERASQLGWSFEDMKHKFHHMDRYVWLKCILKCHLEFVAQDFCPCYFLPTFSALSLTDFRPTEEQYLKKVSFHWIGHHQPRFPRSCKNACALYRCVSNDISESPYTLPAPDPLWERFDRKQLIESLCETAYKKLETFNDISEIFDCEYCEHITVRTSVETIGV